MRIRLAVPEGLNEQERKAVLDAALEAMTTAQAPLIERGLLPTAKDAIRGGVRWRPEPPGDEHFDLLQTAIRRGWGDCDDLAPAHAASLRATGEDPEARAVVHKSGPNRWHAVVERSNGKVDDPSRWAGMGVVGGDEYVGPFWPPMFPDRMSLAAQPLRSGWGGRVDVPSLSLPMLYSGLTHASSPGRAVAGACRAAHVAWDDAHPEDVARLAAIQDLLSGCHPAVVGEALDQIGFAFALPSLLPAAASLAAPILSKVLPGGGGAASPPSAGSPPPGVPSFAQAPGSTIHVPGGPIIVRF